MKSAAVPRAAPTEYPAAMRRAPTDAPAVGSSAAAPGVERSANAARTCAFCARVRVKLAVLACDNVYATEHSRARRLHRPLAPPSS